jgi:O-antigen ligase
MKPIHDQLRFLLTALGLFMLPFGQSVGIAVGLLFLSWCADPRWNEKWTRMKENPLVWAHLAFFGFYLLGMFWTDDQSNGWSKIETKLGFLFLPLVFSTTRFDLKQTRKLGIVYLSGMILVALFMLSRASYHWFAENRNTFFYQDFTDHIMHPSYLAMHFCVGLLILFHGVLLHNFPARPHKMLAALLILFFAIIIFLLASKLGILSMLLIFAGYIIYAIIRFKRYVVGVAALLLLVGSFFLAIKIFPEMAGRLQRMTAVFSSRTEPINPAETESSKVRVLIWSAGMEIASTQPFFGQGTGDVQHALNAEYEKRGMTGARDKELNAHSQLLQTTLALGIGGLLLLLINVLGTAVWGLRKQIGFAVLFSLLFFVNILPESMFQVQAGVLFFSWLNCLILFAIDRHSLLPPNTTTSSLK